MDVCDFDFDLPSDLIAQEPPPARSAARLLHLSRATGAIHHTIIRALPELLRSGDLIVVNNTRVFPARLLGRRVPSGGVVECLLLARLGVSGERSEPGEPAEWEALMHPGQKLKPGARVVFGDPPRLHGEVLDQRFYGRRRIRLWTENGASVDEAVDEIGHVPLPPYVKRPDRDEDQERYQTVFARERGSVAAPTAGLHFDADLVAAVEQAGARVGQITLHVGYGTFQPVRVERVEDHRLEPERYEVTGPVASAINLALDEGRRVIAVGTTTTRTLEGIAAANEGRIEAGAGELETFIFPGFRFRVISGLLTNFHLPKSSLLMLVSAFAGREHVLAAYREAVAERYRFYSYGDAMLIT